MYLYIYDPPSDFALIFQADFQNMSTELLLKEYTKILESGEFSDMEILVGEEPNTKTFRLHSLVLKVRCPYFRTALSNDWIKRENGVIKFEKPNISVEI